MGIYTRIPLSTPMSDGTTAHTVNVCIRNGDKLISIGCDNSCGGLKKLSRSDIVLFRGLRSDGLGTIECTDEVFPPEEVTSASLENLNKAMEWLNKAEEGLV
jgi:hypothetical protein